MTYDVDNDLVTIVIYIWILRKFCHKVVVSNVEGKTIRKNKFLVMNGNSKNQSLLWLETFCTPLTTV